MSVYYRNKCEVEGYNQIIQIEQIIEYKYRCESLPESFTMRLDVYNGSQILQEETKRLHEHNAVTFMCFLYRMKFVDMVGWSQPMYNPEN